MKSIKQVDLLYEFTDFDKYVNFYLTAYNIGMYSIDKLKDIYEDYQSREEDWIKSTQYHNFLRGQNALSKAIEIIEDSLHL